MELARRLVIVLCLAGAIASALTPEPALLRVAPIDFVRDQKKAFWAEDRRLPLEAFIAKKTDGRLVRVQGADWRVFYDVVGEATSGHGAVPSMSERRTVGWLGGDRFYFRPDEPPLADVAAALNDSRTFTYLMLSDGGPARYLGVTYVRPRDAVQDAPGRVLFPARWFSLWLALIGLAAYLLLPRRSRSPEALAYARVRSAILPDVAGILVFSMFFALPFPVVAYNAAKPGLLDFANGWGILTLICWSLSLGGLAILGVAAWHAAYELRILPDRLEVIALFGRREWFYRDMARVDARTWEPPRWLIVFGGILSLFRWRALGPTMLMASQQAQGIEIKCRDGRSLRIVTSFLVGFERLIAMLRERGLPIAPEVDELLATGDEGNVASPKGKRTT